MRISKLVATLWMASAAIFGVGVFLAAQSAIGPQDFAKIYEVKTDAAGDYGKVIGNEAGTTQAKSTIHSHASKQPKDDGVAAETAQPPDGEPTSLSVGDATATEGWVRVAGIEAILRPDPAEAAPMIVAFPVGRQLDVLGKKDGWTKVEEPKTATIGWIKADQLAEPGSMRMARLNGAAAATRGGEGYAGDWAAQSSRTALSDARSERRRSGPLGGLLRRAFGRF